MPNTTPNLGLIKPLVTENYDIAKVTNENADKIDLLLAPKANPTFTGTQTLPNIVTNGIKFPATQVPSADVNTLDDYDEGTFTPTITCASGTITTSSASAIYTKTGRSVEINLTVTITNAGTGAGALNVVGLPFSALTGRNYIGYGRVDVTTGKMCQGSLLSGGASISITDYSNATVIATGAVISFTITYPTT